MAVEIVEGVVKSLGNSSLGAALREYSVIEFGGQVLQGIKCSNALDLYLTRAFEGGENVRLCVRNRKVLCAIELSDGTRYVDKSAFLQPLGILYIAFLGFVGIFLFFLGLIVWLWLPFGISQSKNDWKSTVDGAAKLIVLE